MIAFFLLSLFYFFLYTYILTQKRELQSSCYVYFTCLLHRIKKTIFNTIASFYKIGVFYCGCVKTIQIHSDILKRLTDPFVSQVS